MDLQKAIGKNIAELRKLQSMTQEDLCGLAEMDRSYLSEIENGRENVSIQTLLRIAKALSADLNVSFTAKKNK